MLIIIYHMWYQTFDAVFWITITTIITGSLGLTLKYCLKSKCDSVSCCWGGLSIHRNVEVEQEEEMKAMEMGINESSNNLNIESTPRIKLQKPT